VATQQQFQQAHQQQQQQQVKLESPPDSTASPKPGYSPGRPPSSGSGGRPGLGPRATSFNPSQLRGNSRMVHKRTNSHSPTNAPAKVPSTAPTPAPSLFAKTGNGGGSTYQNEYYARYSNQPAQQQTGPPPQFQPFGNNIRRPPPGPGESIDSESIGVWVKGESGSQQRLNPHLYTYLASINAFSMPLRPNREALIRLYCESVDQVLPLLDREQFIKLHNIGQAPTLLLHAVLLVAARHPQAGQYLGRQSVRQFCATTAAKIRALLFADVEQDRLTLVRIYALLSLHAEGPDGLENSCGDIQKAVHYAVSLGLHHEKPFVEKEELNRLWWTVWCMDRINACVNARPLIIDLKDVGLPMIREEDHANLGRLVKVCYKLERVIYLYRPLEQNKIVPPDVSDMFVGDDTFNPFQAILALLHHTAVILAHKRMDGGSDEQSLEEENVVTEVAGMTAPTMASQSTSPQSPYNDQGNRTMGTMYTPLTMVLAEEKMKMKNQHGMKHDEDDLISNLGKQFFNESDDKYRTDQQQRQQQRPQKTNPQQQKRQANSERVNNLLLSAAGSILRIIKNASDLPPLPLVPYCASLTLTVFLRTYPRHDAETGFNWKDSCAELEKMAGRWWVAGAMGSMGWNVFRSLEEEGRQHQQQQQQQQQQQAEEQARRHAAEAEAAAAVQAQQQHQDNDVMMSGTPDFDYDNFTSNNSKSMEEQFLNMFSDLPNQTSFLDQALTLQSFDSMEPWLEEKDP
jgi:hypothetical protein